MASYKIQAGDTLTSIAKKYNTTVDNLASVNGLTNRNLIYAGNTLEIPGGETSPQPTAQPTTETAPAPKTTTELLTGTENAKPTYQKSDALTAAEQQLLDYEKNKPGEYQSKYADQIDNILNGILNREKFSYNFDADPIYKQYKDQYVNMGKQAMMDTMGNAAALTGGYGNSYATTAGNQAYQAYLGQLNNVIPELYENAYNRYRAEGQDMTDRLGILQNMDQSDYGRYRDTVSDYYNDLNYYYTKYNTMSQDEYNRYLNDINAWQNDRAYYYQKTYDEQQQQNWQTQWDYQLAKDAAKAAAGGGGGGGKPSSSKTSTEAPEPTDKYFGLYSTSEGGKIPDDVARAADDGDASALEYIRYLNQQAGYQRNEYNIIVNDLQQAASNKVSATDIKKYLNEGKKEGYISKADSEKLYNYYKSIK